MAYIEFVIPIEDALTTDPVQAMFCGSMARMAEALRTLQSAGLDNRITILRTEYPERDLSMIDVLNAGCSKGHALARWAAHRGFHRDQVMAIGDNHNDVEMLEFAGHPVIMGNACDELRSRGWSVTLGNDKCGVAAALADVAVRMSLGLRLEFGCGFVRGAQRFSAAMSMQKIPGFSPRGAALARRRT